MERINFTLVGIFGKNVLVYAHLLRHKNPYTNNFFLKARVSSKIKTFFEQKENEHVAFANSLSKIKKKLLFFDEHVTSKMKTLKPRQIRFLQVKFLIAEKKPKQTLILLFQFNLLFSKVCILYVMYTLHVIFHLHFKSME